MKRRTIQGQDHWQYAARISHAPATGRPVLEVIQDDDEVLVRDGDEFVTFWAAQELPPVTPEWPQPDDELDRLRRWKADALVVLKEWDEVHQALGSPGLPGDHKSAASLDEIKRRLSSDAADPNGHHPCWPDGAPMLLGQIVEYSDTIEGLVRAHICQLADGEISVAWDDDGPTGTSYVDHLAPSTVTLVEEAG